MSVKWSTSSPRINCVSSLTEKRVGSAPQLMAICSTIQFIALIQIFYSQLHPATFIIVGMSHAAKTPKDVLEYAKKHDARQLDLRFTDLPGLQHHVSYPITELDEDSFEQGFGMDGSSIRGWAAINESDMLLIPDPSTHMMDPFTEAPTLVMVCDVIDPVPKQRSDRAPRYIAQKAELYLNSTGFADTAYIGAEAEFFIF